jgi:hypothetical protein
MSEYRFRLHADGKPAEWKQLPSSSGLPRCMHCGKTVPRDQRRSAIMRAVRQKTRPVAMFCKNACAIAFANRVTSDVYEPVAWQEPEEKERTYDLREASTAQIGQTTTYEKKKHVVVEREFSYGPTVELLLREKETNEEEWRIIASDQLIANHRREKST